MCSRILLTDGDCRIALPILRSLSKKGINAVVAADRKRMLLSFSKYCKTIFARPYPNAQVDRSLFLDTIEKMLKRTQFDVLFPVCEWAVVPISEERHRITRYTRLPLPSHQSLMSTFDKTQTLKLAKELNVPAPETYEVHSESELQEIARKVTYPAVVKPRTSWVWTGEQASFSRASYVRSPVELVETYQKIHKVFPFPLVQQYIPGIGRMYSIGALYSHSHSRAMCCIKVDRAYPISGGNSVLRESAPMDPKMKEYATKLLDALNWHGIAEVEFKIDPRDNTPKLMEINGRWWASLEVVTRAGMDLPYMLYRLAMDGDVPTAPGYKVGVKVRWIEGDLHHVYNVFRHRFGFEFPPRLRTLINFLKFYDLNLSYENFEWGDPLPFWVSAFRIKDKNI